MPEIYRHTKWNRTPEKVAVLWKRLGYRDTIETPEQICCYGCSSALRCRYGIKECALDNKVDNCGLCHKYPCDKTNNLFQRAFEHTERMKERCSKEEHEFMLNVIQDKKTEPR
jgi:hypothetical protein